MYRDSHPCRARREAPTCSLPRKNSFALKIFTNAQDFSLSVEIGKEVVKMTMGSLEWDTFGFGAAWGPETVPEHSRGSIDFRGGIPYQSGVRTPAKSLKVFDRFIPDFPDKGPTGWREVRSRHRDHPKPVFRFPTFMYRKNIFWETGAHIGIHPLSDLARSANMFRINRSTKSHES
uniref:Uncharacterized protein n=1 Tax=Candidatus Kentrum sp. SD TaxID=2126332 RepID=A0A450Z659_9GAMM|nr:MAG: hypothetical protein BECKSD772F_GA0070984_10145 [Candidatus Kentron sp. SD]VFK49277.1 MAG: hypothetical protein BECKSD772E_GA0070983_11695 [Candidatus Kentron sp. SD]